MSLLENSAILGRRGSRVLIHTANTSRLGSHCNQYSYLGSNSNRSSYLKALVINSSACSVTCDEASIISFFTAHHNNVMLIDLVQSKIINSNVDNRNTPLNLGSIHLNPMENQMY